MEVNGHLVFPVSDPSGAGEARRGVAALAARLGFGDTAAGRLSIVATELAGNLAKHATGGGTVLARPCRRGEVVGVELLSVDRGPGMRSLADCLRDGYSTAGSPGTGLGAVQRLSSVFDAWTVEGQGTVVLSRTWAAPPPAADGAVEVGVVRVPKPGQEVCGDGWACEAGEPGRVRVLVCDGLGHGPDAAAASAEAVRVFHAHPRLGPPEALQAMHGALRATRGAAAAVAEIDLRRRALRYAGVGNISGYAATPAGGRSLVSHNGIVGHEVRKVQEFEYPWTRETLLVMHSDGLSARWSLDRYPGLAMRDPSVIAAVLWRDFSRGNDDATVVVAREGAAA